MSFRLGLVLAVGFAGLACAQTAPSETPSVPSPSEITQIAQKFTSEKLGVWQRRLKLEEWHVETVLVRRGSLPPQTLGGIHWDKAKKTAEIWVLHPADYQLPIQAMLDDMELTIIHELVHLDLSLLPEDQASRANEEYAVNEIVEAMLAQDRAKSESGK